MRFLPLLWLTICLCANAGEPAKVDLKYPFRTDFANEQLPWYQLKPGEFPPYGSEHRIAGELLEADFIHRTGQFRAEGSGELVDFTLPPFGSVLSLNTEADLRDVPLGSRLLFFLYQDKKGSFTQCAVVMDEFTSLASNKITYRLDEAKAAEGKLLVTRQKLSTKELDLGHVELRVNEKTRIWKGEKQAALSDLAAGDSLLVNLAGGGICSDVWVGVETQNLSTEKLRKNHKAFLQLRGLPALIDKVDGKRMIVNIMSGDRASLLALFKDNDIVPEKWAKEHKYIQTAVSNNELRTYNPPVDKQGTTMLEVQGTTPESYGFSGERWVLEPRLLLEGFRKNRVVRIFVHPGWPIKDMPFGEGLYTETPGAENTEEEANQFPFRTDFANEELPWYQLKPGEFPPRLSEHRISGELVKVDALHRTGQFRTDQSGELVDFTMPPFGSVLYLNAESDLRDLPLGMHFIFYLYQDEKGAFTRAGVIVDEFTNLAAHRNTYRLDKISLAEGKLFVARLLPKEKDYTDAMVQPPDVAALELTVDDKTRVWKGEQQVKLSDLAAGDELLINRTGRTKTARGRCLDIYIGTETLKTATEQQRKKHTAFIKEFGLPAWIEKIEGNKIIVNLFSNSNAKELKSDFSRNKPVIAVAADAELNAVEKAPTPENSGAKLVDTQNTNTECCYGNSDIRWILEPKKKAETYHPGDILRIYAEKWPVKDVKQVDKP